MIELNTALAWLETLASEAKFFRDQFDPKLAVVQKILEALGRPDTSFRYRIIVGGTAGKGSTSRAIEQTLEQEGVKTAMISSPHLQVVNERIRLGGKIISTEDFVETLQIIKKKSAELGMVPTYYEAIVLAGILAAKNAQAEILICEVGIGGEFDAVNAVRGPRMSALTFIGNDHLEMFDHSLEKLAMAKAGIFTADSVYNVSFEKIFCSVLQAVAQKNFRANQKNFSTNFKQPEIEFITGIQSKLTKKLAKKICTKVLGKPVTMKPVAMPCRWEKISLSNNQQLILDGAHSGPRFLYILPKIKKIVGKKVLIFGMSANHQPEGLELILPLFDQVIWTQLSHSRDVWEAGDLQKKFGGGLIEKNPLKALNLAQSMADKILVTGSLYLGGFVRNQFFDPKKILEQQTEWPRS